MQSGFFILAGAAGAAAFTCPDLNDQDTWHHFDAQLVNGEAGTYFNGDVAYSCNETDGGITYKQNLTFAFYTNEARNINDTMFLSANLSISAAGCEGTAGVYVNYSIGVTYPRAVWDGAIMDTKIAGYLDKQLQSTMSVTNGTKFTSMNPDFSLVSLAEMASEGVECNQPVLVGAPPVPDCAANVSGLLKATGTDVVFKIDGIEGSHHPEPPGLAMKMSATITMLSQHNSGLCDGEKPFCCAYPDPDCCCSSYPPAVECQGKQVINSDQCTAAAGQTTKCSDSEEPVNDKDSKNPALWHSDCATFKQGIFNFTSSTPGAPRVDLYPPSATITPAPLDVMQFVYAELCDSTIGQRRDTTDCPGKSHGGQWVIGTPTGKTPGLVRIGAKDDKIGNCDTIWHNIYRHLGGWGIFGIILLVAACIGGLGFGGYKYYAKVKRAKEFPSLEGTINDPAAGTGADFAYADIDSVVS